MNKLKQLFGEQEVGDAGASVIHLTSKLLVGSRLVYLNTKI